MEFLVEIDYQQIVDLLARCVAVALPIGLIFGLAEKAYNAFMSMVFGRDRVKF